LNAKLKKWVNQILKVQVADRPYTLFGLELNWKGKERRKVKFLFYFNILLLWGSPNPKTVKKYY